MRYLFSILSLLVLAFVVSAQPPKLTVHKVDGREYHTGRIAPTKDRLEKIHAESWARHGRKISLMAIRAMPDSYDCEAFGLVPPIKDQGDCGSCHIFSALGIGTSAHVKAGNFKLSADGYAEQWALDCQRQLGGCDGGWEWDDAQVLLKGGPWELDYGPYRAQAGACKTVKTLFKLSDMGMCSQSQGIANTADIKAMMIAYGPISIAVAADNTFANYRGGDFNGSGSKDINHAVILTGWKTVNGVTYWKLRNSWSKDWGLNGYMWIKERANQVGDSAFWVKAESSSPSPPDPTPVPTPGTGKIILQIPGQPDQVFPFVIPASPTPKLSPDMKLKELIDLMQQAEPKKSSRLDEPKLDADYFRRELNRLRIEAQIVEIKNQSRP